MTVDLARNANLGTLGWVCGTCGRKWPPFPAYPVCCGTRCRLLDAEGTPFVGSPADRLESARDRFQAAYESWRHMTRNIHRGALVDPFRLTQGAQNVNDMAIHFDRVEAEVATLEHG